MTYESERPRAGQPLDLDAIRERAEQHGRICRERKVTPDDLGEDVAADVLALLDRVQELTAALERLASTEGFEGAGRRSLRRLRRTRVEDSRRDRPCCSCREGDAVTGQPLDLDATQRAEALTEELRLAGSVFEDEREERRMAEARNAELTAALELIAGTATDLPSARRRDRDEMREIARAALAGGGKS